MSEQFSALDEVSFGPETESICNEIESNDTEIESLNR